jgi:hypothetical protein
MKIPGVAGVEQVWKYLPTVSGPLRLLCVGPQAEALATIASSRASDTCCLLADDVATALIVLDTVAVHAVVCGLASHEGGRLFKVMRARHARVLRILVSSPRGFAQDGDEAVDLASAAVTREGAAGIPWLVGSTLGLSPRAR